MVKKPLKNQSPTPLNTWNKIDIKQKTARATCRFLFIKTSIRPKHLQKSNKTSFNIPKAEKRKETQICEIRKGLSKARTHVGPLPHTKSKIISLALERAVESASPYHFGVLSVESPYVFAVFLKRRKQNFLSASTACDLAKRWSRLAVAREAAGIHKGRQSLMHVFFGSFLWRVSKKWTINQL